jgi:hypothetical protein
VMQLGPYNNWVNQTPRNMGALNHISEAALVTQKRWVLR